MLHICLHLWVFSGYFPLLNVVLSSVIQGAFPGADQYLVGHNLFCIFLFYIMFILHLNVWELPSCELMRDSCE